MIHPLLIEYLYKRHPIVLSLAWMLGSHEWYSKQHPFAVLALPTPDASKFITCNIYRSTKVGIAV